MVGLEYGFCITRNGNGHPQPAMAGDSCQERGVLDVPALTVIAAEILIHGGDVGKLHVRAIPFHFRLEAGLDREAAEQHHLGQA